MISLAFAVENDGALAAGREKPLGGGTEGLIDAVAGAAGASATAATAGLSPGGNVKPVEPPVSAVALEADRLVGTVKLVAGGVYDDFA